jgi:Mg/Co/Ni transporter MgtE
MFDPLAKGYIALRPAAAARTLAGLDSVESTAIFEVMPRQLAANVLEQMASSAAARCLVELTAKTGGEILARMAVPAAVAPLRLMKREQMKALLAAMPRHAAARLRLRLRYAETVIGAFVDADVVTFMPDQRVGDALRLYRHAGQHAGQTLYVLDASRHLAGAVDLSDLLGEPDRSMIQRVMEPASVVLNARAALQTVTNHSAWLTHDSLPVVNREGVFQGVLWRSQVMEGERELLTRVADRNELTTTCAALADIFWMGVGALFVSDAEPVIHSKVEE